MMQLEDKLYTSTEVADILGVSLRSIYRYLEDNKLIAEVKTATGRHRFTRQNIIDFLYPDGSAEPRILEEVEESAPEDAVKPTPRVTKKEEEPAIPVTVGAEPSMQKEEEVDWLSKFREAAAKFETQETVTTETEEVTGLGGMTETEEQMPTESALYYRSGLGGLRDIAQNLDKSARMSGVDYAFTLNAGLSLSKPIKPFSLLHSYVRSTDRELFEKMLKLQPSDEENAQLCLRLSDDASLYADRVEMHGLYVVSNQRLLADIRATNDATLISEAESVLA